jgi:hypothetical protein
MAAMNMANFATVSVASAIRLIATIPTALMAAIRSPICRFTSTPRTEWELLSTAVAPGPSGSPCRETRLRGPYGALRKATSEVTRLTMQHLEGDEAHRPSHIAAQVRPALGGTVTPATTPACM